MDDLPSEYGRPQIFLSTSYKGEIKQNPQEMVNNQFQDLSELLKAELFPPFKESLLLYLAYLFSEKEIEEILKVALDKKINESDANAMKAMDEAQDFCMDDACWFAGWLDSQKQVA